MRSLDFAAQLNVSLANGWGIVRTVADLCLKMPEGKYVLVKDPNKVCTLLLPNGIASSVAVLAHFIIGFITPLIFSRQPVIRLYAVPFSAFVGEDDEGAASEEEAEP